MKVRSPAGWRIAATAALSCALAACGWDDSPPASTLTLEQKIGQMVMMGFAGATTDEDGVRQTRQHIGAGRLGGVIFYRYNVNDPAQVATLTQAFAQDVPAGDPPLLIALDQEGGRVQRLSSRNGFRDHPSAQAVANTMTPQQSLATYHDQAQMIAQAGFNLNMAPVVDLRGPPGSDTAASPVIGQLERSYSNDPATVIRYAKTAIQAHHEAGVLTALKHYPGHGLASGDSHHGLVDITDTYDPVERYAFRSLIQQDLADAIMGAHLVNRNIDPAYPVTLSTRYLEPMLRGEDGFRGVIITDDLFMGAIQQYHDFDEIVLRAIAAGNDLLVFSNNPAAAPEIPGFQPMHDIPERVIATVLNAIERGELSVQRIDASYNRLIALRNKLGKPSP